ncbi:MAG TPA: hypothetical protein VNO33_17900 [Kofleriaceae bacterium]|nr:hypothetical protein [Kofleriaceae bacterium]
MGVDLRNVGGTRGGLKLFLFGLALAAAGAYLLLNQVQVHGGYWRFGGYGYGTSFGLTLIPLLIGVGLLFADARSVAGWLLTGIGAVIMVAGIIANLNIHFRQTSLYNTLIMLILLFGGVGLIFRSLRAFGEESRERERRAG